MDVMKYQHNAISSIHTFYAVIIKLYVFFLNSKVRFLFMLLLWNKGKVWWLNKYSNLQLYYLYYRDRCWNVL